jgi:RHS repeat-associated protein
VYQLVSTTQGTVVNTFGYNANGDQTVAPGMVSTFNVAPQTVSVAGSGGMVTYRCDGNGNRTSSSVAGVTTRFDWDTVSGGLGNVTAESVAGTVTRKYAYGHDMVRTTNGTTNSFLFTDPVGTITHLVSSSGVVQAQYLTGAYGVNKTSTVTDPAVSSNPIRFTGQYTDPTTGNVYLRARQYNPAFGAFTQIDPLAIEPGNPLESAYVYSFNNPLRFTDPSGKRGGECSYCDGDSIEYAHWFLKYKTQAQLEALYVEFRTNLPLIGEGSGPSGSDTHEVSMLLPRRTGQAGLPTLAWSKNAFDAITMIWAVAPKAGKLLQPKPNATIRVTSWAPKGVVPDLTPGRWVQKGGPSFVNFVKTGIWRGDFTLVPLAWNSKGASRSNFITAVVDKAELAWPSGKELLKGLLGQRVIR